MDGVAYQMFDGAAGFGLPSPERLLQIQEDQQHPPQEQQYYPSAEQQPGHFNGDLNTHRGHYYEDQNFYNEILSKMHGFGDGEVNGATDVGVSDAMASFGFNSFLFIFLMVTYEIVSRMVPSVYRSRKLHVSDDSKVVDIPHSILPLSWVPAVLETSWMTVRKCGGLDSYFFLRFIRMCFRITFVSGLWGMIVLWPVFATGNQGATGWYFFSMANIGNASWRLWFPTCFMILLTIYVLFVMNEEFRHYLDLRMQYLAEGDAAGELNPQAQHSLIVEELPRELRSDTALYEYFDKLFPGQVHSARVVLNIPDLEKVSAKRKRTARRLEKSIAYHEAAGIRGTHVVGTKRCTFLGIETFPIRSFKGKFVEHDENKSPQKGERVDSIIYYRQMLDRLNEKVVKMQMEARLRVDEGNESARASEWLANVISSTAGAAASSLSRFSNEENGILGLRKSGSFFGFLGQIFIDFLFGGFALVNRNINVVVDSMGGSRMSSTGFVTFNNLVGVTMAAKLPLSHDPDVIKTEIAPDPRDIIWANAHVNESYSRGREVTANVCTGLGALLWSTIVASIQTISNIDHLATVPGLSWLQDLGGGQVTTFVNGYLPVVALLAIIGILPSLFKKIAYKFESRKTQSDVQNSILGRYFYYQLANIYITVTSGSIWMAFSTIVDHPGAIFEILGRSLPTMVGFFVSLLMTKTLAGLPMVMLRIPALLRKVMIRVFFRQKFLTQREIDEVYKKESLQSGEEYPNQLLVIVICFTYACISPIILPIGAIYFLAALIVYKKQILLVYAQEYESGGSMFPSACRRTLIGLIMSQFTLIGYSALRQGFYQPIFLLPLPFITFTMMNSFDRMYTVPSSLLSLDRASQLDSTSMVKIQFDEELYRQPVLAENVIEPLPYRIGKPPTSTGQRGLLGVFSDDLGKIV